MELPYNLRNNAKLVYHSIGAFAGNMMQSRILLIASILTSWPSYAATTGVFCKGKISFIARPEQSGLLAFKIMGSTSSNNVVEVGGSAQPHAGGWRYQVKSTSSPEERCTLDIKEISGGYTAKTVDGARCQSSGGFGAYQLISDVAFPARSLVQGLQPPNGAPDDFPAVDCVRKKFFSSAEPKVFLVAEVSGDPPTDIVRNLIAKDTGGWSGIFAEKPTSIMKHFFTEGFNRSWAKAMTHNQDEPVLDGDPITGQQMVTRVQIISIDGGETRLGLAHVVALLKVSAGGETKSEQVRFDLKLEGRGWKIDDIKSGDMQSIRTYFRKSYKS